MQPRLIIEQKITAFVNKYRIYTPAQSESEASLLALAQQKRIALKEKVMFYGDEKRDRFLYSFRAEKVLDVHGRYLIEDRDGRLLGMFKKEFLNSLVNSTWRILNKQGDAVMTIRESNATMAILRRFGGEIPFIGLIVELIMMLFRYNFEIIDDTTGQVVGIYRKTTLFFDKYSLDMTDEGWHKFDWRVYASIGVALDALQSR